MNADEAGDFRKGRSTDPREQAILDLALAITRTRGADAAPQVARARSAGLTDAELVEVVAAVAQNILTNYLNVVAGTEVDFPRVGSAGAPLPVPCGASDGSFAAVRQWSARCVPRASLLPWATIAVADRLQGPANDPRRDAAMRTNAVAAVTPDAAPAACAKNEGDGARADRAVHRRRPASYAAWLVLGGIGTYVDHIHELFGVVAYPDPTWIGERLPVSPAYLAAGVGFFLMYTAVVGHRGRSQGLFGGRPLSLLEFVIALGSWLIAYTATGALGAMGGVHPVFPWLAAALLLVWALPELWLARRTWFIAYAAIVAASGVTFEWIATAGGGYVYPVCPSSVCAGTSVPIVWLSLLYVHVALFVHRLQGGRSFVARWLAQRLG